MYNRYIIGILLVAGLYGCHGNKQTSPLSAEAQRRGVEAAKTVLTSNLSDEMELQFHILDAKAVQSEYILMGDTIAAGDFDEAFRKYITTNNKALSEELFQ